MKETIKSFLRYTFISIALLTGILTFGEHLLFWIVAGVSVATVSFMFIKQETAVAKALHKLF